MKTSIVKKIAYIAAAMTMAVSSTACGSTDSGSAAATSAAADSAANAETAAAAKLTTDITVVSREDGSGTRGAFVELTGVEEKDADGNKADRTTEDAIIANSTDVVMTQVAGNESAIGYISLGSLNDTVKALDVNGVECSVADIKSGDYVVARPFNVCYQQAKLDGNAAAKDLIAFIESDDGQKIIADNGYIAIDSTGADAPSGGTGAISLNGSTSVGPIMEKLCEAYKALNPDVSIDIQQTGSVAGSTSVTEGTCDIGMSSRELKQEELDAGLTEMKIADDGIAVIVTLENPIENITSDEVMKIYTGEINNWSELG